MQPRPITDDNGGSASFAFKQADDEQGILSFDGAEVGALAGVELVGYFVVPEAGWLVVTDCDCPFEEMVHLHLLGADLRVVESRALGGAYTPGIVEGMKRLAPARFRLLFPSRNHEHLITVERRVRRFFGRSKRWLHVTPDT